MAFSIYAYKRHVAFGKEFKQHVVLEWPPTFSFYRIGFEEKIKNLTVLSEEYADLYVLKSILFQLVIDSY